MSALREREKQLRNGLRGGRSQHPVITVPVKIEAVAQPMLSEVLNEIVMDGAKLRSGAPAEVLAAALENAKNKAAAKAAK